MNIYKISQELNVGYDTYDSAIVAANSEDEARKIHPSSFVTHLKDGKFMGTFSGGLNIGGEYEQDSYDWVAYSDLNKVKVELLGVASVEVKEGILLASFNAG